MIDEVNKCKKCQNVMPLPFMGGKQCSNCGTYQPTLEEIEQAKVERILKNPNVICNDCGSITDLSKKPTAKFCGYCGQRLDI